MYPGIQKTIDAASEVVGLAVERKVDEATCGYEEIAIVFAKLGSTQYPNECPDSVLLEFVNTQLLPALEELNSWLDW